MKESGKTMMQQERESGKKYIATRDRDREILC